MQHRRYNFVCFLKMRAVPQSRVRVPRFGKPYYAQKDVDFREMLTSSIAARMIVHQVESPEEDLPLALFLKICLEPPKSWPKWKKEAALNKEILPVSRPDLDNYLKAILDAGTGYIWIDDAQIVQINASLEYAQNDSILLGVEDWETYKFKTQLLLKSLLHSSDGTVGVVSITRSGSHDFPKSLTKSSSRSQKDYARRSVKPRSKSSSKD